MFCCDGISTGNPGVAGLGVVVRHHSCQVLGVLAGGVGTATNYIANAYAIICAVELAVEWKISDIIINSDSQTVLQEFEENRLPWMIKMRWIKASAQIYSIQFIHSFKETNFSANAAAKKGAILGAGQRKWYSGRPGFLARIEQPNITYYRMC
ncbi:uncharacterized protein LOC113343012 [Papaver somniferum]|uniref:uncharacterized protein LOC113343012 n=1 Tax=Papaver somniferum TaxID=3469 RepID=UPI000E6F9E3D|nr:uncharacterized protein LOC113343012 [Papaver somniferum]